MELLMRMREASSWPRPNTISLNTAMRACADVWSQKDH